MSVFEKTRGALVVLRRRLMTQPIMRRRADHDGGALLRFPATLADLVTTDPVGGGSAS